MIEATGINTTTKVETPESKVPAGGNLDPGFKVPAGGNLDKDQFITLLVTQLQNQDPLEPLDNADFIAQLATFSSLEKLTSIDEILKNRLADPGANNATV